MIEIGGKNYADDYCTACPEGTYNEHGNSTHCTACPANTYANVTGATQCTPCPPHQFSYSEASNCDDRRRMGPSSLHTYMHINNIYL